MLSERCLATEVFVTCFIVSFCWLFFVYFERFISTINAFIVFCINFKLVCIKLQ